MPIPFIAPTTTITLQNIGEFPETVAFHQIISYIERLNFSVKNSTAVKEVSKPLYSILFMLETIEGWITDTPLNANCRFGNTAFRTWLERIEAAVDNLLDFCPAESRKELAPYLLGSFGNSVRIDYGSGHELSFVCFLCCLEQMQITNDADHQSLVNGVFARYIKCVRTLLVVFKLEPAGSRGVWGLDDHFFLPYLFGSSQLLDHPHLRPKSITNAEVVEHYQEWMYISCIHFINTVSLNNQIKTGPFHEHSPVLFDISGVKTWSKVNSGMFKMYLAEVLAKFPVVQHLLFGSLLPWTSIHLKPGSGGSAPQQANPTSSDDLMETENGTNSLEP